MLSPAFAFQCVYLAIGSYSKVTACTIEEMGIEKDRSPALIYSGIKSRSPDSNPNLLNPVIPSLRSFF